MTNTSYTIVINGHSVVCDSAQSVIALLNAASGKVVATVSTSAPAAAPKAPAPKKAAKAKAAPAAAAAPKAAKAAKKPAAKRSSRKAAKKSAGLSSRSVAFLSEVAKSGGSEMSAEKLAKATGAKGVKGLGGSLAALRRELSSFGYNIDAIVGRKKSPESGTTFHALTGASGLISEIMNKVPKV